MHIGSDTNSKIIVKLRRPFRQASTSPTVCSASKSVPAGWNAKRFSSTSDRLTYALPCGTVVNKLELLRAQAAKQAA